MLGNLIIVPIPRFSRKLLELLPGWRETTVAPGRRIVRHSHDFLAFYFTFGIEAVETETGQTAVPGAAVVIVPPNVMHGWIGPVRNGPGIVGHFHAGHRAHTVESLKIEA